MVAGGVCHAPGAVSEARSEGVPRNGEPDMAGADSSCLSDAMSIPRARFVPFAATTRVARLCDQSRGYGTRSGLGHGNPDREKCRFGRKEEVSGGFSPPETRCWPRIPGAAYPFFRTRLPRSSAICTALRAAPLRRLSETHQRFSPFSMVESCRIRLI